MHHARTIIFALLAIIGLLGFAAPAIAGSYTHSRAGAASCPTGPTLNPYMINNNGNIAPWIWLTTSDAGEVARSHGNLGRLMYWTGIGCTPNGWPMGYWENYKHRIFSSSNTCGRWVLKNDKSDNGTVTIDRLVPNESQTILLASRYCNSGWKRGVVNRVWYGNNKEKSPLALGNVSRPKSGAYYKWHLNPNQ